MTIAKNTPTFSTSANGSQPPAFQNSMSNIRPGLMATQQQEVRQSMTDFWIEQRWYYLSHERPSSRTLSKKTVRIPGLGNFVLKNGKWNSPEIRIAAINFLILNVLCIRPNESTGQIKADDVTTKQFREYDLAGMISVHYHDSSSLALFHAGLIGIDELKKHAVIIDKENPQGMEKFFLQQKKWCFEGRPFGLGENEMIMLHANWSNEKVNKAALEFFVDNVLGKECREAEAKDFNEHRLGGLLSQHYHHSAYEALASIGRVGEEDEHYMRRLHRCSKGTENS